MSCIYKIINNITGEIYIGKTKYPAAVRFDKHKRQRNCKSASKMLYESFNKYGCENFSVETLVEGNFHKAILARHERLFINQLKPQLNMKIG